MSDVFSYVLSGIAIAVALLALCVPNRSFGKKVAAIAAGCAAIGLFFPAVGFYVWIVVIAGLCVAFLASIVHGFKTMRW